MTGPLPPAVIGIANQLLGQAPVGWRSFTVPVVKLVLLATVWDELE